MGLLRQIPREDWRGADRVPEVHGLGSSRTVPWVGLSCRVVPSLADNTNRWTLLFTKKSLITLRELQDFTRRATVSWATSSTTERWPLSICLMMIYILWWSVCVSVCNEKWSLPPGSLLWPPELPITTLCNSGLVLMVLDWLFMVPFRFSVV